MKSKVLLFILLFMGLFSFTGCMKKDELVTDAMKFKEEYESLNGTIREKDGQKIRTIEIPLDNPIIYKNASDIVKMMEDKQTFIVYFGFSDCPWCRSVIPTLFEVAKDKKIDKIYYVDVKSIRDTLEVNENGEVVTTVMGSESYYQLLNLLGDVLSDYNLTDQNGNRVNTDEKRIGAPNVVAVVDGVAKSMDTGISEEQKNGYVELTDEMRQETYNKFSKLLDFVVSNNNVCAGPNGSC